MTKLEILEGAILEAIENGFKCNVLEDGWIYLEKDKCFLHETHFEHNQVDINTIIFSKYFAKCFWGDVLCCDKFEFGDLYLDKETRHLKCKNCGSTHELSHPEYGKTSWQYHLKQMVLEDDPVLYLGQFLDKKD
jgi:hypothetical protein